MSIAGRMGRGEDITEPVNALQYFTNREAAIEVFCRFVNDEPPRASVLFFHGAAGVGRSLLLRHLQTNCGWWLDRADWAALHHLHGREFVEAFERRQSAAGALPAPVTLLNFADPAVPPTDVLGQLLALRRQLGEHRLACPLFDFAVTWYLHQQGRRPAEEIRRLLPTDATEMVAVMIDAASGRAVGRWPRRPLASLAGGPTRSSGWPGHGAV